MLGRIDWPRVHTKRESMETRTTSETLTTRYDPDDQSYERQLMIALDEQEQLGYTTDLAWFDDDRK